VNGREGTCRSDGTLGLGERPGNLGSGREKDGRRGGILSSNEAVEHLSRRKDLISTRFKGEESNLTVSRVYVCVVSEGSLFGVPWVPKLGTRASPSKVDKTDITEQLVHDWHDWSIGGREPRRLSGG